MSGSRSRVQELRAAIGTRTRQRLERFLGLPRRDEHQEADRAYLHELARAHDHTARSATHATQVAEAANAAALAADDVAHVALDRTGGREEVLAELHRQAIRLERAQRAGRIAAMHRFLDHRPPDDTLTVSVVLPTRDRSALLARAVTSVLAQTHRTWELLVVDDGSVDDTAEVIAGFDDERIRPLASDGVGATRARNVALEVAKGDVLVYLDDDNVLDRQWCQAVAWTFATHPEASCAYGARIVDSWARITGAGDGGFPDLQFEPFDRATLERGNFVDMGTIAHRNGLGVRFDPELWWFGDWDLMLTLTRDATPLEIPAIAVHYLSEPVARLSDSVRAGSERYDIEAARVQRKHTA